MNLRAVLKQKFGFEEFRGQQEEIISSLMRHEDALVIMPTGAGKSLCFQFPAVMMEGLTLVVSPLIALMKDQVDQARARGLQATFINSSLTGQERRERLRQISAGRYQLLYVTPERFRKEEFWQAIESRQVSLLAIDEAHCVSQWGHDFRPDYSRLGEVRQRLGQPTTVALTATATEDVRSDIIRQLHLDENVNQFFDGFERPNLQLNVLDVYGTDEKIRLIAALRGQQGGSVVVYFSLIQTLERISSELQRIGMDHLIYHGQMGTKGRKQHQETFLQGEGLMILATPAFGLGIDKPNIRTVIHAEIPGSIEAYYQEVGRAGRDGLPSDCYLLFDPDDISIQMDFIKWSSPDPNFIQQVYLLIQRNRMQVQQQGHDYLREQMNFYNRRDFRVETAVNLLQRWDCLSLEPVRPGARQLAWEITGELPEEYLGSDWHRYKLETQNKKLLGLVQLAQNFSTSEELKSKIYEYFNGNIRKQS